MIIDRLVAAVARQKKDDKGFSLIELLVVVIIIGILAAIAIPIFLNQRQGAWRSAVESDVANARIAVETALMQSNGSFANIDAPASTTGPDQGAIENDRDDVLFAVTPNVTIVIAVDDQSYTITGTHSDLGDPAYEFNSATGASEWDE